MGFLDNVMGGGFTKALNNFGGIGSTIGNGLADLGSIIGNKYGDTFTDSQIATQSLGNKALGAIPVVGQALQIADGLFRGVAQVSGTALSNIDPNSAKRLNLKSAATTNNILNHIPLISGLAGGFGLWSERTNGYQLSDEAEEMQAGYSGTLRDLRATEDIAGKRLLGGKNWGSTSKANGIIDSARRNDDLLAQINETNTMRKQSNYYQDLVRQNINRYAGENYLGLRMGKSGMRLMSIEEAKSIISKRKDTQKLQNRGVVGIDTNILPEGALHARKNNLSELNDDLKDATKKGIPVMAAEEGGELNQVAEIEHSELILRLDVTQKLEELRNDGSEEAMIEAGKLIVQELNENTQDNVGMLTKEGENGKD